MRSSPNFWSYLIQDRIPADLICQGFCQIKKRNKFALMQHTDGSDWWCFCIQTLPYFGLCFYFKRISQRTRKEKWKMIINKKLNKYYSPSASPSFPWGLYCSGGLQSCRRAGLCMHLKWAPPSTGALTYAEWMCEEKTLRMISVCVLNKMSGMNQKEEAGPPWHPEKVSHSTPGSCSLWMPCSNSEAWLVTTTGF